MNNFPVSCQNCFSHKRQFYVFLDCKHFMCLSCTLCLADFQNLSVRCCYRNTKMSQELAEVMYEEINKRKLLKQSQAVSDDSMIKQLTQIELQKKLSNQSANQKPTQSFVRSRIPSSQDGSMQESTIVHTFKIIDENMHADAIKQSSRTKPQSSIAHEISEPQDPCFALKPPLKISQTSSQTNCPTFKRIHSQDESSIPQSRTDEVKQNFICWKNYDNSKDRILAKLNYHQQKMNWALRQNYNYERLGF